MLSRRCMFACLVTWMLTLATTIFAAEKTITGKVNSVNAAKNTINFGGLSLDVSRKTKITIKGATATLADIKQGQNADVRYHDELLTAISIDVEAELTPRINGVTTNQGKIVSIDPDHRIIVIAFGGNTRQKPREFEISRRARISLDQAPSELRHLEIEQLVELEAVPGVDVVTKINAKSIDLKFVSLFDGRTLDGWTGDLNHWQVSEGVITGTAPKLPRDFRSYLSTDKTFKNFVLKVRFKSQSNDSSIIFREKKSLKDGLQVLTGHWQFGNLADETGHWRLLGSLDDNVRRKAADAVGKDEWNDLKINAIGGHFAVFLNGVRTAEVDYPDGPENGQISLKLRDSSQLRIKEIEIAELPSDS